jgi:hypothetical protein
MSRSFRAWGASLCLAASLITVAVAQVTSSPASYNFPSTDVAKTSTSREFTITNSGTKGITINSVSFDCAAMKLSAGVAPQGVGGNGGITHYSAYFAPSAGGTYSCNMILAIQGQASLLVPLTGRGIVTRAVASLSTTSLSFGSVTVGSASSSQTVTITNTGTQQMKLQAITVANPNFVVTPPVLPYTIFGGASVSFPVTYNPPLVQTDSGVIDFTYDSVPDQGIQMSGSGTAASTVAITSLALLPNGTASSAYQVQLQATGGTPPINWGISAGSVLPKGLKGNKSGTISGTLDPSVAVGAYSFNLFAKDSKGVLANKTFTLNVYAAPGGNCANTVWDVAGTTTPVTAITDLGTGTYLGYEAGLYPNGSNVRPAQHDSDGVGFANAIGPLDSNGKPSSSGIYAMVGIGESTAQDVFGKFLPIAVANPQKNSKLVIVNAAQGGATPANLTALSSAYWSTILNNYIPDAGITANQVVVVWFEDSDGIDSGTFPSDITTMQTEYETIAQQVLLAFPNVKLMYFSSRIYAGYANGVSTVNPEPYAYEAGYAVKWAIGDQINGAANLNYNPNNGPVVAPWIDWGPYYWSNGMLGRNDGLVYTCQDLASDGTHPSQAFGDLKVANLILQYFLHDDTTTPWFLQH